MSGLREALDEALTTVEQGIARSTRPDREGFLMTSHVRQLLAAHPAPDVTDELVRVALDGYCSVPTYGTYQGQFDAMRAALVAALSTSGEVKP